jgi:hypothetical protein
MAGKVGKVMSVTEGYGFTIHDDTAPHRVRVTIAFATTPEATTAQKQMAELFAKAVSVKAPPG